MQSMPLLLRHSLRSGIINLSRAPRPTRPLLFPAASPKALPVASRDARRSFSVCLQCRFRTQNSLYASHETDNLKDGKPAEQTDPSSAENPKPESEQPSSSTPTGETENIYSQGQTKETNQNVDGSPQGGGLPSYLEGRRSQFSKQFTDMMDNLQSNVFVAGQRLNDLTGYSSIEALKNEIHAQEERLRSARLQVRAAKDAYAAAINRRSTSQREVNELLQRKHAWSPADLERFTHLYRNDHTNEVAENEAQEKLSGAEREAEEASAALSKSILSRYHEEQVWSDKIRRMSTWGTWGLMGVNVLLFLIFQIAVEPWRRKRLVKGFEEKVIEAIEKEKTMNHVQVLGPDVQSATPREVADATQSDDTMASSPLPSSATPATTTTTTTSTSSTQKTSDEDSSTLPTQQQPPAAEPNEPTPNNNVLSQLSRISPPPETVDSWRQYFHDLFSERSLVITQRDLSTVALQSAAAGAAVMGLVIALIRPR